MIDAMKSEVLSRNNFKDGLQIVSGYIPDKGVIVTGVLSLNNPYNIYQTKYSRISKSLLIPRLSQDLTSYSQTKAFHSALSIQGCSSHNTLKANNSVVIYCCTSYTSPSKFAE